MLIVAGLLGFAFWRMQSPSAARPVPTIMAADTSQVPAGVTATNVPLLALPAIERRLTLKTIIPDRPRYQIVNRTVLRGDSISAIAKEFKIKSDTLLFANYDVLEDNPDSLRPGQELNVPPVDGILYQWQAGDTLDKVATKYKANAEDVLNWPGNNIDLTAPTIKVGQWVMIPGGTRESKAQIVQTVSSGPKGSSGCPAGIVGRGFFGWPAGNHYLSGNDYSGGHPGIDIAASEGSPIYAADGGVVSMSQDGWNYGYGSVIQIDHGNGYVTLYAHLSVRNVGKCDNVGPGQLIGSAGNTGNSFGAHLHFEIRLNGSHVNPWDFLGGA